MPISHYHTLATQIILNAMEQEYLQQPSSPIREAPPLKHQTLSAEIDQWIRAG